MMKSMTPKALFFIPEISPNSSHTLKRVLNFKYPPKRPAIRGYNSLLSWCPFGMGADMVADVAHSVICKAEMHRLYEHDYASYIHGRFEAPPVLSRWDRSRNPYSSGRNPHRARPSDRVGGGHEAGAFKPSWAGNWGDGNDFSASQGKRTRADSKVAWIHDQSTGCTYRACTYSTILLTAAGELACQRHCRLHVAEAYIHAGS